MRLIYVFILLLLAAAVGIFVVQNNEVITLQYFGHSVESSPWFLLGVVYLLGMVTGGTVVGFVRRSVERVSEGHAHRTNAA